MDLGEFLLARIAEDEATARAAIAWQDGDTRPWVDNGGGLETADGHGMAGYVGVDVAPHIVRWSPARVLAECEAKRRIADEWREHEGWASGGSGALCFDLIDEARFVARGEMLGRAARLLAQPHASHPDFRPEWSALADA